MTKRRWLWNKDEPPAPPREPEPEVFYGGPMHRDVTLTPLYVEEVQAIYELIPGHYYLGRVGGPRDHEISVLKYTGKTGGKPLFTAIEKESSIGYSNDVLVFAHLGTEEPVGDQG